MVLSHYYDYDLIVISIYLIILSQNCEIQYVNFDLTNNFDIVSHNKDLSCNFNLSQNYDLEHHNSDFYHNYYFLIQDEFKFDLRIVI